MDFPISTGKEGNVFRGITPDKKFVAVKIYRTSTSTFKHISNYIVGDPRFKSIRKTRRDIVYAWTKREFKNLVRLHKAGVKAPKPIIYINNVLVMEYIGNFENAAPLLKDVSLENPKEIFDTLINFISKMYRKAELVHGDISAYNVLIHDNKPYLIDLGQGVLVEHPNALEFLKRDIHCEDNQGKDERCNHDHQCAVLQLFQGGPGHFVYQLVVRFLQIIYYSLHSD